MLPGVYPTKNIQYYFSLVNISGLNVTCVGADTVRDSISGEGVRHVFGWR